MKDIYKDIPGQSEDALQQKCYFWFWNNYPNLRGLLFSVPNGGTRDQREVRKLKDTGMVSGVSDLIFLHRTKASFIELKRDENSKQSGKQRDWQRLVESQGFDYFVVRSLMDFKKLIQILTDTL